MSYVCAFGLPLNYDDIAIFFEDFQNLFIDSESKFYTYKYLFTLRHNSHVNLPSRFLALVSYCLFSSINLSFVTILCSLFNLLLALLFYRFWTSCDFFTFLPVFLLVVVYDSGLFSWPIASTYVFTILFPFLCFNYIVKRKYLLAGLFAVLSFFTDGSGVLTFVFGFLGIILIEKKILPKFLFSFIWIGLFSISYFINANLKSNSSNNLNISELDFGTVFNFSVLENFFTLLGIPFSYFTLNSIDRYNYCFTFGLCFFLFLIIIIFLNLNVIKKQLPFMLMFLQILSTFLAISIFRDTVLAPRYEYICFIFFALSYIFVYEGLKNMKIKNLIWIPLLLSFILFYIRVDLNERTKGSRNKFYEYSFYQTLVGIQNVGTQDVIYKFIKSGLYKHELINSLSISEKLDLKPIPKELSIPVYWDMNFDGENYYVSNGSISLPDSLISCRLLLQLSSNNIELYFSNTEKVNSDNSKTFTFLIDKNEELNFQSLTNLRTRIVLINNSSAYLLKPTNLYINQTDDFQAGGLKIWNGSNWTRNLKKNFSSVVKDNKSQSICALNSEGVIFCYVNESWKKIPGKSFSKLNIDSEGNIYVLDKLGRVNVWKGSSWITLPGAGFTELLIEKLTNVVWTQDKTGRLFYWDGTEWRWLPGNNFQDIHFDMNGNLWTLNSKGKPLNWKNGKWEWLSGAGFIEITSDMKGNILTTDSEGHIFSWDGSKWSRLPGIGFKNLSVDTTGYLWAIGKDDLIFFWDNANWNPILDSSCSEFIVMDNIIFAIDSM